MRASPASGLDARRVPRLPPDTFWSRPARVARRGVVPWVALPRRARLSPRRPLATRASSDDVPSGEAHAERAPARAKSNSARAKGGGGARSARGRPPNSSSEWRAPATKAASTRAKAAERRGASLDSQEEGASTSSSAAEVVATTSNGARGRRRDRSLRSKRNQSGSKTPNANTNDPFASLARGALTAELEKELGRAVQELLRAEAMRNRLCEETIAAEMRADDVADDVFSKAFGKKTVRGAGKQNPRSINPSRASFLQVSTTNDPLSGSASKKNGNGNGNAAPSNENDASSLFAASPAFRKRLALALGYADARALDVAVAKGRAARRAFVTHNFGLAARVANDIYGKLSDSDRGLLSRDDLTLYGCAGLARAADRFDPDRGYKFSTYCYFWVRKAVLDGVKDCGRTIRLPKYLSEVLRETRKAERDLEAKLGRAPSDVELAEATETDVARVREWRDWARTPLSLDAGAGGGAADADDGALVDGIAAVTGSASGVPTQSVRHTEDGPAASAEADADADLLRDALDEALATLLPREQFVLRHRFGLASASARALACASTSDGAPPDWLRASSTDEADSIVAAEGKDGASRLLLGSLLGVSAETVRTIERRGLAKLKQPSRAGVVLPLVDDETRARIQALGAGDEGGGFAAALAEAAEKADKKAGGGRVFGTFAGGAVPASALAGGSGARESKRSTRNGAEAGTTEKSGRRAPRRGKKVPRPAATRPTRSGAAAGRRTDARKANETKGKKTKEGANETKERKPKEVLTIRSA